MDQKPQLNLNLIIKIQPDIINYPRIDRHDFFSNKINKKESLEIVLVKNMKRKRDDNISYK